MSLGLVGMESLLMRPMLFLRIALLMFAVSFDDLDDMGFACGLYQHSCSLLGRWRFGGRFPVMRLLSRRLAGLGTC